MVKKGGQARDAITDRSGVGSCTATGTMVDAPAVLPLVEVEPQQVGLWWHGLAVLPPVEVALTIAPSVGSWWDRPAVLQPKEVATMVAPTVQTLPVNGRAMAARVPG
ncbi:hypothetical protein AMTR_s00021p00148830 [Amborella trichopoda]|uniref:Uncharacterized protein n=1 Tax=Amborella trichopoda TaxID=13333 RepID=W1Q101_AMBTC|nr:hypothetical protein AMTR_s00021p00148830 [Amborella trichopoda]